LPFSWSRPRSRRARRTIELGRAHATATSRLPALAGGDDPVEELVERLGDAGVPAREADPVELVLGEREHRSRPASSVSRM
jgi:hypothetical protein